MMGIKSQGWTKTDEKKERKKEMEHEEVTPQGLIRRHSLHECVLSASAAKKRKGE
jgi:hypothetical protein